MKLKSISKTFSILTLIAILSACSSMDKAREDSNYIMNQIEQAGFQEYDVTAETNHNKATLKGYVSTEAEKMRAEQIALAHPDIDKVDNQLKVMFTSGSANGATASSGQLADHLLAKIKADHTVKEFNLKTQTAGRKVQLSGEVGSYQDYVRLNEIVNSNAAPGSVINLVEVSERLTDAEINSVIRGYLAQINRSEIASEVVGANLTLRGDVNSFEEVDRILSVVVNTPDLKETNSQITVKGRAYPVNDFNISR